MSTTTIAPPSSATSTSAYPTDTSRSVSQNYVPEILAYLSIASVVGAIIGLAIYFVLFYKRPTTPPDVEEQNKPKRNPTRKQSRNSWASDSTIDTIPSPRKAAIKSTPPLLSK